MSLTMRPIKVDRGLNAKRDRIESLEPLFRNGQLWVRADQNEFLDEYYGYPGYPTKDVLDALGYASQTWNAIHAKRILDLVRARRDKWTSRKSITGY
jgi:phage terminase large subunit-like protein